jgi:hypothetical protein
MRTCVDRVNNELRFKDIVKTETFFLNYEESRYDNSVYVKIDGVKVRRCFNVSNCYCNAFCISSGNLCFIKDDTPVQRVNVKLVNDD